MTEAELIRAVRRIGNRVRTAIQGIAAYNPPKPRATATWLVRGGRVAIAGLCNGCSGSALQHAVNQVDADWEFEISLLLVNAAGDKPPSTNDGCKFLFDLESRG